MELPMNVQFHHEIPLGLGINDRIVDGCAISSKSPNRFRNYGWNY
jgi:hypothetical protein